MLGDLMLVPQRGGMRLMLRDLIFVSPPNDNFVQANARRQDGLDIYLTLNVPRALMEPRHQN